MPLAFQVSASPRLANAQRRRRRLAVNLAVVGVVSGIVLVVWAFAGGGYFWPMWPWFGLSTVLAVPFGLASRAQSALGDQLVERVDVLTRSDSGAVDGQAAELRRIERELHDGPQSRLVSLGMSLGLAQELLSRDPQVAAALLAEARSANLAALNDLRTLAPFDGRLAVDSPLGGPTVATVAWARLAAGH